MGINYQAQLVQDCFHQQCDGQVHFTTNNPTVFINMLLK